MPLEISFAFLFHEASPYSWTLTAEPFVSRWGFCGIHSIRKGLQGSEIWGQLPWCSLQHSTLSCREGLLMPTRFFFSSFYADRVLTNQLLWHLCTDWIRQSLRKLLMSNPFYQKDRLNSCLMMHFKCIFDVFQKQRHFSLSSYWRHFVSRTDKLVRVTKV